MKTLDLEKMEKLEGSWNREVGCGLANIAIVGSIGVPGFGLAFAVGLAFGAYMSGCYDGAHY